MLVSDANYSNSQFPQITLTRHLLFINARKRKYFRQPTLLKRLDRREVPCPTGFQANR